MLNFFGATFFGQPAASRRVSLGSRYSSFSLALGFSDTDHSLPTNGFDVYIGRLPRSRVVHISQAALRGAPALRENVTEGSTITNTDYIVFEIAMEDIEQSGFLGKMRPVAPNPFEKLTGSSDMMLKLAKAWHLGHMLALPQMQNKLIDTFSACYRQFLETRMRMPLSPEPFEYLRDHLGYYTLCEKFLILFYAGLARHGGEFRSEELEQLPKDIAEELQYQRAYLMRRTIANDQIAQGNVEFKVIHYDKTLRSTLHVLPPSARSFPRPNTAPSSRPDFQRSTSSMSTVLRAAPPQPLVNGPRHRTRLSLPALPAPVRQLDRAMERTLQLDLTLKIETEPRPRPRSTSISTTLDRTPFQRRSPGQQRRQSRIEAEADSSDDESVYDLFAPHFRWRSDSHQRNGGEPKEKT
ncbi:hypothetical protein SNOG_13926 [Parastagonospora nodorum SN15]|uniref:Uncharacterized protein n=1 Tax=Phaeosphaeria nodorum (strain SN15 / ATCC MYA-4574 / FGSC 10173) TaxID=321614 RepID=Q0U2Q4_PHANO|nr:hypothetical protein SNOG_13926 [Parastagonospora nodorum SN15]EAT78551.2 hypothetical protein SNOG_13926 [Parastagonospora nodorum SN15]